jgi:hypothetical protein
MKKVLLISILLTIIFSCEKGTDFCDSKECQNYFKIWKDLFISRNQLTESYFIDHVFPYKTEIESWNDGQSFRVEYKIRIDWAEAILSDQFSIWLDPSTAGLFPSIPTPRSTYLSKDQINKLLDIFAFSSTMHKVATIDHLKYSTRADAISELQTASGIENLGKGEVYYQNPSFREDLGHPLLRVSATINLSENKCMQGTLDLATGDNEIRETACVIYWCFVRGTKITLSDGSLMPIEKVKPSDEILSYNIEKLSIENDIVEKIDSVYHSNIIKISFDDSTINENTADHPYYVKGKGWCSFKPSETFKNYKIKTKQLQTGDVCFKMVKNKLLETKIKTIAEIPGKVITYNISKLHKNKSYFANGILVSTEEN